MRARCEYCCASVFGKVVLQWWSLTSIFSLALARPFCANAIERAPALLLRQHPCPLISAPANMDVHALPSPQERPPVRVLCARPASTHQPELIRQQPRRAQTALPENTVTQVKRDDTDKNTLTPMRTYVCIHASMYATDVDARVLACPFHPVH